MEPSIDESLVERLLAAQFPEWAGLPVRRVLPGGNDNHTFRVGHDLSVRLPSAAAYASQVEKENAWLPRLASSLTLPVPIVRGVGEPEAGYPYRWSVRAWLPGEPAQGAGIEESVEIARSLAAFQRELRMIDATGGPTAGVLTFHRGAPLSVYAEDIRRALAALGGQVPTAAIAALWDSAIATRWRHPATWFHGDVASGNLLVADGRLAAVIDFGQTGVGDPACDTVIAWTYLSGSARSVFLDEVDLDSDTLLRGRGWALWKALITLERNPQDVGSRQTLAAVLTT